MFPILSGMVAAISNAPMTYKVSRETRSAMMPHIAFGFSITKLLFSCLHGKGTVYGQHTERTL